MVQRYIEAFSQLAPKQMIALQKMLVYAGISMAPATYVLVSLVVSILLGVVSMNIMPGWFGLDVMSSFIGGVMSGVLVSWGALAVMADRKTRDIEENLPDTLLLISQNVRAGETIDWAIISSLKHSYGPIKVEFDKTARELASGVPVEEAFNNLADRNRSAVLRNVVDLILFGIQSGGNMSDLLTDISFEIRMTHTLQKEVESQVSVYRAFFIIIILLIAPVLLAVSTNFLFVAKTFGSMLSQELGGITTTALPMQGGMMSVMISKIQEGGIGGQISMGDMRLFSYLMCATSSIVASMLLGVISRGEAKSGIRYIPVFLIVSILVYYYSEQLVYQIMDEMFGGLLSGG
jgi:Flp pilus assembly protein TadB